ncbi:MAG: hypothetical protein PHZ19_08160, partial [Candidatus Thermoplasmatota archaeon]|nr:hypothetical protein [Candidatus Thermoplasmatota archaeon]
YNVMSDCFEHGPLTVGINLLELSINYQDDLKCGDVKFYRCPFNSFVMDPYFTERDLSDCQYILRRRMVSKAQARALLPGHDHAINALKPQGRDMKFTHLAPSKDLKGKNFLRYDQFYRMVSKTQKYVLNLLNGDLVPWEGTTKDLDSLLNSPTPLVPGMNWGQIAHVVKRSKMVCKTAIFLEEKKFYDGDDPTGLEDYPFIALLGFWEPEYDQLKHKLCGLVRDARDPQHESNKRRVKMLDIIDSVISSGLKVKEKALVDRKAAYMTGQGRVLWIKDEADIGDVEQIQSPGIPAGLFEFTRQLDEDILDVLGLNAEIMGMPDKEDPAEAYILAKLRQAAGLTIFQPLFDQYRKAKKQLGNKLMAMVQANFDAKKVARIIQQQPSQEFFSKEFRKYDCTPVEGVLSDTQQQMAYAQLLGLKKMGAPIPWNLIIKYSPLELKEELVKGMESQEQMQQLQLQVQMAAAKAEIAEMEARAEQYRAYGYEAVNKAKVDRLKVAAEIANMDQERLMKLVGMALQIEQSGAFGLGIDQPEGGNVIPMRKEGMITKR